MNSIRQTQALNRRELETAVPPEASWHADYRDTAYIFIGGFGPDLSEGDLVTIFSQYGNPTWLRLMRDRDTGKSKGFGFLKYEDQRSCDLAVDNLGGAEILGDGRLLRVDHTRYRKAEGEDEDTWKIDRWEAAVGKSDEIPDEDDGNGGNGRSRKKGSDGRVLKEERELEELVRVQDREGEEVDPMRQYLIEEKREELHRAREKMEKKERKEKRDRRHLHHHRHRRHHHRDQSRHGDGIEDRDHKSRRHDREEKSTHEGTDHRASHGRRERRDSLDSRSRSRSDSRWTRERRRERSRERQAAPARRRERRDDSSSSFSRSRTPSAERRRRRR